MRRGMGRKTRKEWRREDDDEGFVGQSGGGGLVRKILSGWLAQKCFG